MLKCLDVTLTVSCSSYWLGVSNPLYHCILRLLGEGSAQGCLYSRSQQRDWSVDLSSLWQIAGQNSLLQVAGAFFPLNRSRVHVDPSAAISIILDILCADRVECDGDWVDCDRYSHDN